MANKGNLIPQAHVLTVAEASKGGKRSGEVRRERKKLRQELIDLLSTGDTQERMATALIKKALEGDVRAFITIRDTIGEKPTDAVEVSTGKSTREVAAEIDAILSEVSVD